MLDEGGVKAECVIMDEGAGTLVIKNIAVIPEIQEKGYGKVWVIFCPLIQNSYSDLQVGMGEGSLAIPFYEKCGFTHSHTIPDFFTNNYDCQMYEDGV